MIGTAIGPLAHVASRGELPVDLWIVVWGVVALLGATSLALARRPVRAVPSFPAAAASSPTAPTAPTAPAGRAGRVAGVARGLVFAVFLLAVAAGLFGGDGAGAGIAPVVVLFAFWVVVPSVSAVVGDVWRVLDPLDTLAAVIERNRRGAPEPAPPWSRWLAPAGVAGFVVLEVVHPSGDRPRVIAVAVLVHTVAMLAGARRWGRAWLRQGNGFAVLFSAIATVAPRRTRLVEPSPIAASPVVLARVLLVVLAATLFDGLTVNDVWDDVVGVRSTWVDAGFRLAGLAWVVAVVAVGWQAAVRSAAPILGVSAAEATDRFALVLAPVVLGAHVAHYAQSSVDDVQRLVFAASDPFDAGWDLFGGADGSVDPTLVPPDLVVWIQVAAIVVGHAGALVLAHRLAVGPNPVARASPGSAQASSGAKAEASHDADAVSRPVDPALAVRSLSSVLFAVVVSAVALLWLLLP